MPSGVEEVQESSCEMEHSRSDPNDADEEMEQVSTTKDAEGSSTQDANGDHPMNHENDDDEGVEVVLGDRGSTKVVDNDDNKTRASQEQSIFRQPHPVRPRPMRAPSNGNGTAPPPAQPHPSHRYGHPPQPYVHGSGSWGYGPPPPPHQGHHPGEYPPPPRPYPVPPYTSSGSFDDQGYHHHPPPHYSPHVQYPPPGGRHPSEEVNVISPNHKGDPHYRPPLTPRPRQVPPGPQPYYHYPPTSPVSRPSGQTSPGRPGVSMQPSGPPRLRNYAIRRGESAYARAQRPGDPYHPPPHGPPSEEGAWNQYPPHPNAPPPKRDSRGQPPVVAESFDSEHPHRTSQANGPPPLPPPPPPPPSHDPYQFYGGGGSWGSFDSAAPPPPMEDPSYYHAFPPDSPYSPYAQPYSPGAPLYRTDSFPPQAGYGHPPGPPTPLGHHPPPPPPSTGSFSYSVEDDDRYMKDYHHDRDGEDMKHVTPPGAKGKARSKNGTPVSSNSSRNMILPKAAEEVDFDVTDPPTEPILPPSEEPCCESLADVNGYDVLCGRGGGTNSQIGNRRFRKLVQEFQPTYLMAKRKEKPLLARTIVLIIRKRGGRFLKKNEDTGELFEVGDTKAEAKTSQALREGLDVRATKSAANSLVDKKKKKKSNGKSLADDEDEELDSPCSSRSMKKENNTRPVESPPTLPRLQGEEVKSHPHSPEQSQLRKRRRVRSTDRFFPDFCPPRAEIGRPGSPSPNGDDGVLDITTTPMRRESVREDEPMRYEKDMEHTHPQGCAGIALDIVTGAAAGSFCLGPTSWR